MKILKPCFAILLFTFCILNLTGCATYKFHHGAQPYDKGYLVSRDDYTIVEYTVGRDNSVPKIKLAKQRFKRRRFVVEDYYKKMGYIENHFKRVVWDPWVTLWKIVAGIFRLPFIAISDYRYEHDPKYREKIKKLEQEKDAREEARIKQLKDKLNAHIQADLAKEEGKPRAQAQPASMPVVIPVPEKQPEQKAVEAIAASKKEASSVKEELPKLKKENKEEERLLRKAKEEGARKLKEEAKEKARLKAQERRQEELARKEELRKQKEGRIGLERQRKNDALARKKAEEELRRQEKLAQKETLRKQKEEEAGLPGELKAVIIATPKRGRSPLKVHFCGNKSHSLKGKITSYSWDFGDGETSVRINPVNTYYSGTFEPRQFNVTLTVTDTKGNSSTSSVTIEVINK